MHCSRNISAQLRSRTRKKGRCIIKTSTKQRDYLPVNLSSMLLRILRLQAWMVGIWVPPDHHIYCLHIWGIEPDDRLWAHSSSKMRAVLSPTPLHMSRYHIAVRKAKMKGQGLKFLCSCACRLQKPLQVPKMYSSRQICKNVTWLTGLSISRSFVKSSDFASSNSLPTIRHECVMEYAQAF